MKKNITLKILLLFGAQLSVANLSAAELLGNASSSVSGLNSSASFDVIDKPRVFIQSDGEVDDKNSLVRALLYANDVDIDGIIGSYHQEHPESKTQWAHEIISAYGQVHSNLLVHDADYPTASELHSVVVDDKTTAATDLVINALLDNDEREIWYLIWGPFGSSTLGDVMTTLQNRSQADQDKALSKLRLYSIYGQSLSGSKPNAYANWFPGRLKTIVNTAHFGAMAYGTPASGYNSIPIAPEDQSWRTNTWQSHYENHGALSNYYTGPDDGKSYIYEGDTPSFLHVLPVGLRSTEDPTYGGWGGRFTGSIYDGAHWRDDNVAENNYVTRSLTRWFEGSETDYAARNDWANNSSYSAANHPPIAGLGHPEDLVATPGSVVNLSAAGSSDPDNDTLSYQWYQYPEADTYNSTVIINNANSANASFTLPSGTDGETVHVILEVKDTGTPALTRYRRVIVTGDSGNNPIRPIASINTSVNGGITPLAINFDGTQSSDADGAIESYEWTFGDGNSDVGAVVSHVYTIAGNYTATLRVTDNEGLVASTQTVIVITDEPSVVGDIVTVDNQDANASAMGYWVNSGGANPYNGNSQYSFNGSFTWGADLPRAGKYEVQAYWTHYGNRTEQASYTIDHMDGEDTVSINQRDSSLATQWVTLGTYSFNAGTNNIVLTNHDSRHTLSADAVRFIPVSESVVVGDDQDLTDSDEWRPINNMDVTTSANGHYVLTHPGNNYPILKRHLPALNPGDEVQITVTAKSMVAGARLVINPWALAATDQGHFSFDTSTQTYTRSYTNITGSVISGGSIELWFDDQRNTGGGQTIEIKRLQLTIMDE